MVAHDVVVLNAHHTLLRYDCCMPTRTMVATISFIFYSHPPGDTHVTLPSAKLVDRGNDHCVKHPPPSIEGFTPRVLLACRCSLSPEQTTQAVAYPTSCAQYPCFLLGSTSYAMCYRTRFTGNCLTLGTTSWPYTICFLRRILRKSAPNCEPRTFCLDIRKRKAVLFRVPRVLRHFCDLLCWLQVVITDGKSKI